MEFADWNAGSVLLNGLDLSMTPTNARSSLEQKLIEPFPEKMITNQLKQIGSHMYCHEKQLTFYKDRTDNNNILAYFMCASYQSPNKSDKNNSERQRFRDSLPLPLAQWENLYYALVAHVRQLYSDLQEHYGNDFENGHTVLHTAGNNGAKRDSTEWTVVAMAGQLEQFWHMLMDQRLVAKLDHAVRFQQTVDDDKSNDTTTAPGLMDVNSMTPAELLDALWAKHGNEKNRQSGEIEDVTWLALARAEVRQVGVSRSNSNAPKSLNCQCPVECDCRMICNFAVNNCECKHARNQISDLVNEQQDTHNKARQIVNENDKQTETSEHLFGASSNEQAQMQVAACAMPSDYIVQVCHTTSEEADRLDSVILEHRQRRRAGTDTSDLAYVPESQKRTPTRGPKEVYPLGFYGEQHSGQRYPTFRGDVTSSPPPVFGGVIPARKPVPTPIETASEAAKAAAETLPTPPKTSPYGEQQAFAGASSYYGGPISDSYGLFPAPLQTRHPHQSLDYTVSAAEYSNLATQAQVVTYHPSTNNPPTPRRLNNPSRGYTYTVGDEDGRNNVDKKNANNRSATPNDQVAQQTKAHSAQYDLPSNPQALSLKLHQLIEHELNPPVRENDYFMPRPALKQRYVSAGGDRKLSDRPEIAPPEFVEQATAAIQRGVTMSEEDVMRVLADPEWVKANFGQQAVGVAERLSGDKEQPSRRPSGESQEGGKDSKEIVSRRSSGLDRFMTGFSGEKRERTSSGASGSGRFDKLRRVFSRRNSECE